MFIWECLLYFRNAVWSPILFRHWPPFWSLGGELAHFEKILEATLIGLEWEKYEKIFFSETTRPKAYIFSM